MGSFNKIHIVSFGKLNKQRYQELPQPALEGQQCVLLGSCSLHTEGGRELDRRAD